MRVGEGLSLGKKKHTKAQFSWQKWSKTYIPKSGRAINGSKTDTTVRTAVGYLRGTVTPELEENQGSYHMVVGRKNKLKGIPTGHFSSAGC